MLLKQKSITSKELGSFNRGKSAIPSTFNGHEILSPASDKPKLFAFLRTKILLNYLTLYLLALQGSI